MKEHVKDKWVTALRSGKYEQTDETLQSGTGYCCLGVLCVLAEKEGVSVSRSKSNEIEGGDLSDQAHVKGWSRIVEWSELVEMNDDMAEDEYETSHVNNFNDIADYIDKNWEAL